MVDTRLISAHIPSDKKARFALVAHQQGLSESALLKRLVYAALLASNVVQSDVTETVEPVVATGKISVRLRPDDLFTLRERATARGVPTGTYVSFLIRSHLRSLPPLLVQELAALKSSLAELSAIGRNLNQIAHALNRGEHPHGPDRADLQALLRALGGLRDHTKSLITTNLTSWNLGYEKANH
jgi:hypothetical protein